MLQSIIPHFWVFQIWWIDAGRWWSVCEFQGVCASSLTTNDSLDTMSFFMLVLGWILHRCYGCWFTQMVPLGYIRIHTGMYPNCNMIYYPTEIHLVQKLCLRSQAFPTVHWVKWMGYTGYQQTASVIKRTMISLWILNRLFFDIFRQTHISIVGDVSHHTCTLQVLLNPIISIFSQFSPFSLLSLSANPISMMVVYPVIKHI